MIGIDIKIPDCCFSCPMSHWIQTGRFEGRLMCNIIERILIEKGTHAAGHCIVNENSRKRPDKCPLIELEGVDNDVWYKRTDR